jgi:hypothetical protein
LESYTDPRDPQEEEEEEEEEEKVNFAVFVWFKSSFDDLELHLDSGLQNSVMTCPSAAHESEKDIANSSPRDE